MFALISVDVNTKRKDLFTYFVPNSLEEIIKIGSKVEVEFHKRLIFGYVVEILESIPETKFQVLPVLRVVEPFFSFTVDQVRIAQKIKEHYDVSYYMIFSLMSYTFLDIEHKEYFHRFLGEKVSEELEEILNGRDKVLLTGKPDRYLFLAIKETEKGTGEITLEDGVYGKRYLEKHYYTLDSTLTKTPLQKEVVNTIKDQEGISENELINKYGFSRYILEILLNGGAIREEFAVVVPSYSFNQKLLDSLFLSLQETDILNKYSLYKGKTFSLEYQNPSLYYHFLIKVIEKALKKNESLMIVVPTILRGELIYRELKKYFNDYLSIIHSFNKKSDNFLLFHLIKENDPKVVITTPKNMFLPLFNLKHVIMDTEDSEQYQMTEYPYLSFKEVVKFLRDDFQLVYASQTLSLTTYYETLNQNYLSLNSCHQKLDFIIADMQKEIFDSQSKLLGNSTINFIKEGIENGERVLVLVSNLSSGKKAVCENCGETLMCPKCFLPLRLIKEKTELVYECLKCSLKLPYTTNCSFCGSHFEAFGVGIDSVYSELASLFPLTRIQKISHKELNSFKAISAFFKAYDHNIIVGTQYLLEAKETFDIKRVVFVNFDDFLLSPSYNGKEEAFLLLRKACQNALVIVNTFNKTSPFFNDAKLNLFYDHELNYRQKENLPPYKLLLGLHIHKPYEAKFKFANYVRKVCENDGNIIVYDPFYDRSSQDVILKVKTFDFKKFKDVVSKSEKYFSIKDIDYTIVREER